MLPRDLSRKENKHFDFCLKIKQLKALIFKARPTSATVLLNSHRDIADLHLLKEKNFKTFLFTFEQFNKINFERDQG